VTRKKLVKQAMSEDLKPSGDITTALIKNNKKIKAKIISNQNCVVGGLDFVKETFKNSDKKINFKTKTKDGRRISKGKVVAIVYGKAKGILKSERVALNFLSLISGVATTTRKFVNKIKGKSCKICCTRKTAPNLRSIQKYGVKLGGGLNHRFNLSDEYLIKDNHIAKSKNPNKAVTLNENIARNLGIGNSTGLGMAPFIVNHPTLLHNWIYCREKALKDIRSIKDV